MKQLTYIKPRTLAWRDVPEPSLRSPTDALVRPFVAGRCDGDGVFLRGNYESAMRLGAALHVIDPAFGNARDDIFKGPFAYGHEGVAEVIAVGDEVRDHAVGDVVVLPWSVSCGACGCCGRGLTSHCEQSPTAVSAYGLGDAIGGHGGMVSDLVRVPHASANLVSVPKTIDPLSIASASDNMTDGYRAVAPHLERMPGAPVLVLGGAAKSVALYAAGIAVAKGASRVDYVDDSEARLHMAERLGANPIQLKGTVRWLDRGRPIFPSGYPITVDGTGTVAGLTYALTSLAPGGVCTAVGFYLRRGTPLPLWNMYMKSASLHVGISHPHTHLPSLLCLIEQGKFDPSLVTQTIGAWQDADRLLLEPATKAVVHRRRLYERAASDLS